MGVLGDSVAAMGRDPSDGATGGSLDQAGVSSIRP